MSGTECSSSFRKRPKSRLCLSGSTWREADQVADDRADRRAPAAARRQIAELAAGTIAAHLVRDLPRHLEQIAVEQEEAGEPVLRDHPQLLVAAAPRPPRTPPAGSAAGAHRCRPGGGRSSGVSSEAGRVIGEEVVEILGQVERRAPLGDQPGCRQRLGIGGEALGHLLGRAEIELVVRPALAVAAIEVGMAPDRDQHVLEPVPPRDVVVDVAGRDVPHPDMLGELDHVRDPAGIAEDEVVLELDEDLIRPKPSRHTGAGPPPPWRTGRHRAVG